MSTTIERVGGGEERDREKRETERHTEKQRQGQRDSRETEERDS